MSLAGALVAANSGLSNINYRLGLVSQNVANASTPGYAAETSTQTDLTAAGVGYGVHTGPATRDVNAQLQSGLYEQNAAVTSLTTQQSALQSIDGVLGTPGQSSDLGSLLNQVQDDFSSLATAPANQTEQAQVVADAQTLTQGINTLSNAYGGARQAAQEAIVSDVGQINTQLASIGTLSTQIVALRSSGQSTADLENQRDAAVQSLSQLVSVKPLEQQNGDMLLFTTGGVQLPIHGTGAPLSTSDATLGASTFYPGGGIPGIMLGGLDVTRQLTGGSLGGNIALRDTTLPTSHAELDEFSQNLASRFSAQGLTLFSDPNGNVPSGGGAPVQSGYIGFASEITVNPAVAADPSLVRDGTQAIVGSPTGASAFTPNPVGGPAGFTTMITRVLNYALGADAQPGVGQPASQTTGLGPTGALAAPYSAPTTLAGIATALTSAQAQASASVTTQATAEQSMQTTLASKLAAQCGVSIDTEMSDMIQLQNAYGANAKIIGAVQAMWAQLIETVS